MMMTMVMVIMTNGDGLRGGVCQCSVVCVAYLGHVPVDEAVTREGGGGFEHVGHGRHLGRGRGMRVVL